MDHVRLLLKKICLQKIIPIENNLTGRNSLILSDWIPTKNELKYQL